MPSEIQTQNSQKSTIFGHFHQSKLQGTYSTTKLFNEGANIWNFGSRIDALNLLTKRNIPRYHFLGHSARHVGWVDTIPTWARHVGSIDTIQNAPPPPFMQDLQIAYLNAPPPVLVKPLRALNLILKRKKLSNAPASHIILSQFNLENKNIQWVPCLVSHFDLR